MIFPIQQPSLIETPLSLWQQITGGSALFSWIVLLGLIVCLVYAGIVIFSSIKARNAEPTASFVSLACAERMADARPDGTRHYLVQTDRGFPDIGQFRDVLPAQAQSFRLDYRNEVHSYCFRASLRPDAPYEVFILKRPGYGDRPADDASTYRLDIGTAYERIDFAPGMEPRDLPDACRKAVFWAESNTRYIQTGRRWSRDRANSRFYEPEAIDLPTIGAVAY